jgi:superfamily II DNA or RNA helicase
MNGAGLGDVFDSIILGPTNQWLTDNGFLSPARYYAPPQKADISKVHTRAGDYVTSELEEIMDDGEITGDAVSHYRRLCDGVPMLVFCVSVAHAHHVAEEYRTAGYRAAAVDGKLSDEDRADRISGLGNGKYQVITSCDLIGEGLDVPVVSAVQLLRPTQSPALHLQQIGRGLRPAAGKEHLTVLDHVGNTRKHGFASTEREWALEGKKKSDSPPPTRTCSSCYSVHRAAKTCPYCGFDYPVVSRELTAKKIVDGELVEVVQTKEERRAEEENATTFAELVAIAKSRGYKKPQWWAMKRKKKWVHTGLMPRH